MHNRRQVVLLVFFLVFLFFSRSLLAVGLRLAPRFEIQDPIGTSFTPSFFPVFGGVPSGGGIEMVFPSGFLDEDFSIENIKRDEKNRSELLSQLEENAPEGFVFIDEHEERMQKEKKLIKKAREVYARDNGFATSKEFSDSQEEKQAKYKDLEKETTRKDDLSFLSDSEPTGEATFAGGINRLIGKDPGSESGGENSGSDGGSDSSSEEDESSSAISGSQEDLKKYALVKVGSLEGLGVFSEGGEYEATEKVFVEISGLDLIDKETENRQSFVELVNGGRMMGLELDLVNPIVKQMVLPLVLEALVGNESLKTLRLCNGNISDEDVFSIVRILPEFHVEVLDLRDNKITDTGVKEIEKMLSSGRDLSLLSVNLEGNHDISPDGSEKIAGLLRANIAVRVLKKHFPFFVEEVGMGLAAALEVIEDLLRERLLDVAKLDEGDGWQFDRTRDLLIGRMLKEMLDDFLLSAVRADTGNDGLELELDSSFRGVIVGLGKATEIFYEIVRSSCSDEKKADLANRMYVMHWFLDKAFHVVEEEPIDIIDRSEGDEEDGSALSPATSVFSLTDSFLGSEETFFDRDREVRGALHKRALAFLVYESGLRVETGRNEAIKEILKKFFIEESCIDELLPRISFFINSLFQYGKWIYQFEAGVLSVIRVVFDIFGGKEFIIKVLAMKGRIEDDSSEDGQHAIIVEEIASIGRNDFSRVGDLARLDSVLLYRPSGEDAAWAVGEEWERLEWFISAVRKVIFGGMFEYNIDFPDEWSCVDVSSIFKPHARGELEEEGEGSNGRDGSGEEGEDSGGDDEQELIQEPIRDDEDDSEYEGGVGGFLKRLLIGEGGD